MVVFPALLQPEFGLGPAGRHGIEVRDHLLQAPVVTARTEIGGAFQKGRIRLLIAFLQKAVQDIRGHELALCLVHDPEIRIQIDLAEIIPQQIAAEAVDGRDLGVVDQSLLPAQMGVGRILPQAVRDGPGDTLPHLGGRRPGKSNDQQAVYVQRTLSFADHADDPLHQNGRLAAAGCRGDQYIMVTGFQDPCLFFSKLDCHDFLLPIDKVQSR